MPRPTDRNADLYDACANLEDSMIEEGVIRISTKDFDEISDAERTVRAMLIEVHGDRHGFESADFLMDRAGM